MDEDGEEERMQADERTANRERAPDTSHVISTAAYEAKTEDRASEIFTCDHQRTGCTRACGAWIRSGYATDG